MATKKQRRRREKLQRHEYEYVVENEEGEEIVVESARDAVAKPAAQVKGPPRVVDKRGRVISPPSWARTFKRSAIFAPILLVLIWVTGGQLSTAAKILNAAILVAIFVPFSYFVDVMIYRTVQRRQAKDAALKRAGTKSGDR